MAASREEICKMLRTWREDSVRNSEEILELYETDLQDDMHKLGDERWMVYEQVFIAALDCDRQDVAKECLSALNEQFPGSLRVRRLSGLLLESIEHYDEAVKIYNKILVQDESNSTVRKRKVAVLKAQGKINEAIKELNEYLKRFMSDQEAWMELCDLYLSEQEYGKAAFCFEELILYNPHNHLYNQRYAEIKYTQGGQENMELARSYFAKALQLNPNNIRAAYGLFLSASNIASSSKSIPNKRKENSKYAAWSSALIAEKYKAKCPEFDQECKSVQDLFKSLQVSGPTD